MSAPGVGARPSVARILEAARVVDPVFTRTPQFVSEPLSDLLGVELLLKVECVNPVRSFKGRGTDYLLHRLGGAAGTLVCASAGNFGQGLAYAARKREVPLTVFAALGANPMKVARMRALGAEVVLQGADFDAAKDAAREHAGMTGALFVEDGALAPVSEGAGSIAVELSEAPGHLDAILVPVGNGALVNGIGRWLKERSPATRVIGVCAAGAPAMERSWRAASPVATEEAATIADGIAIRVPVPEAVAQMRETVDDMLLVADSRILEAMRLLLAECGLVVEPAGAAGLAALLEDREAFRGLRVAVPVCGGNLAPERLAEWLR